MLVAKQDVPAYDERLRGYFENKAVHIRHMAASGVGFVVHPAAFVVHMPHPPSAARQWIIDPANQATRDLIQASLRAASEPRSFTSMCALCHTSASWGATCVACVVLSCAVTLTSPHNAGCSPA